MQYTLDQAIREISTSMRAYGTDDAKAAVNRAIQALAGLSGWECLRRTVRIFSAHPSFALPQGCAALVRACVHGRPVTVRGQDFQFLHSGPGDILRPPHGFRWVPDANIVDMGAHPLEISPAPPFTLRAYASAAGEPPVAVKGFGADGRAIRVLLPVGTDSSDGELPDPHGHGPHAYLPPDTPFSEVTGVSLDDCAERYVELWCTDAHGNEYRVATYHPDVKVPSFRRYALQGAAPGGIELLAEVRLDPLPLVEGSDVLPFDSLEPVEWMIQMSWYAKSGEIEAANRVMQLATGWLRQRETVAAKVQTAVVNNSLFRGSMGEMSMEAMNI